VPSTFGGDIEVVVETGDGRSEPFSLTVGEKLADDLHIVANPSIDPKDGSIIVTRSGARGHQLPVTIFRLSVDGDLEESKAVVLNPTATAFDPAGQMFVTNRSDGEVLRVDREEKISTYANDLGIVTGIAFDRENRLFVGDRRGTIYRVSSFDGNEEFAQLEPSVAAYHLAFGADGDLYVTSPGLSSHDNVYKIDQSGKVSTFYKGLGRPQGLAFDNQGNLYVAACLQGRRGIIRIDKAGETADLFLAGANLVGLCFTREGEMIVASNEEVFLLPVGIVGTILN
jgi:glucose/arabinose dehydrogenase